MMVPDVSAQRTRLVELLEELDVRVFAAAPSGTIPTRFILLGMPSWTEPAAAIGMHQVEWPVMVCVGRDGTNDTLTALALEGLWPQVLTHLLEAFETDQTLGGLVAVATVTAAVFEPVLIGAQEFPAQLINIKLEGA